MRNVDGWQSLTEKPSGEIIGLAGRSDNPITLDITSKLIPPQIATTPRALLFMAYLPFTVDWLEGVVENIVSHVIALVDAVFGVEVPMYAQVNPTLCVGPFRFAKRFERGGLEGHVICD